ncbi:MAG: glutamine-hydrolyzing GMP synthase [Candidatus Omnitrophota bacterium]
MLKGGILIIDYGSQYNQLIARRVRENSVYCRIVPPGISAKDVMAMEPAGIILSGGPSSVYLKEGPKCDPAIVKLGIPVLGICYGMQLLTKICGGNVQRTKKREYGRTRLLVGTRGPVFKGTPRCFVTWMSHGDYVSKLPPGFQRLASTDSTRYASIGNEERKIYGVQFHPEVVHTEHGARIITNFLVNVCGCRKNWTMKSFVKNTIADVRRTAGGEKIILGLSGGVDSSVVAALLHRAIGKKLVCIFVDNGLLRHDEAKRVNALFSKGLGINLITVNAARLFMDGLRGVVNPEKKRKIIGRLFIKVFEKEAKRVGNAKFLAQGTLYPDVIESQSAFGGPSAVIKSHHNVGGLPKRMGLSLIEPLRELFKDEVRKVGRELGLPDEILKRQPFPGPGLAIRVMGAVTADRLEILRKADSIMISEMKKAGLYYTLWQTFPVLLPINTVGIMGDERTYEFVVALRAVTSQDGMTADWARIPYDVLGSVSSRIINEVKGVNRVVFDISSKPPSTIEWE